MQAVALITPKTRPLPPIVDNEYLLLDEFNNYYGDYDSDEKAYKQAANRSARSYVAYRIYKLDLSPLGGQWKYVRTYRQGSISERF